MNKKIFMVVLSIFLMLIVIGCVSAADSDNITSTDDTDEITCNDDMLTVDESSTEGTDNDNLSLSEENTLKATDGEVLSTDYSISSNTFDDINSVIVSTSEGGILYLSGNTYNSYYTTTVKIEISITLNGASDADSNNKATLDGSFVRFTQTTMILISASNVVLKNIIFKNGYDDSSSCSSGAVQIVEGANNVTIENCTFINNKAYNNGGAIIWEGGNGLITDSIFEDNSAENFAGAIFWSGANGTINNVTFTNNSADSAGAIYWTGSNGTVNNVTFTNNTINRGSGRGAAIAWGSSDGKITNTTFIKNTAKSNKAVVYVYFTNGGQISGCYFANNTGGYINLL